VVKGTTKGPGGDPGMEFFAPEFVGGEPENWVSKRFSNAKLNNQCWVDIEAQKT